MTPIWLIRFNDALPWLNPLLGLVAGVLAALVMSAAAGRLPVAPAKPAAPVVRVVQQPAAAACQKAALPPEWQELSRYDEGFAVPNVPLTCFCLRCGAQPEP